MEENTKNNNCTNDDMAIYSESACSCGDDSVMTNIPNEYFYNSCECDSCNCGDISQDEMICSCGYVSNPFGLGSYSCQCNGENIY